MTPSVVDPLQQLPRRLRRRARRVSAEVTRLDDGQAITVDPVNEGPVPDDVARDALYGLDLSQPGHLAEAYHRFGHDPRRDEIIGKLVEKGIAPMAGGMPLGGGGLAFQHNLPPTGTYVESSESFFKNTERNDIPQQAVPFPGLGGGGTDLRIPNVGVLAAIRLVCKFTVTVSGTGAVSTLYGFPWNLAKRVSLNVNGQTGIISAEGLDIRARRQRVYRNPREQVSSAPNTEAVTGNPTPGALANGTYAVVLVFDLPITHDDYNLVGCLYAQSDQNSLYVKFEAAQQQDVFTVAAGGAVSCVGNIFWTITVYDVPSGDTSDGRKVLLPNMSWLHGFLAANQPFQNNGEVAIALIRTAGQLLATFIYLDNGGTVQIDPLALTEASLRYGGNRRPRVWNPVEQLIEKNVHDYNGRIQPGFLLIDNEVDNPVRDLVVPKGVTELQVVATIPAATTINANARAHFVEETMFVGR